MKKACLLLFAFSVINADCFSQVRSALAQTPPMGWSSWYPFVDTINEQKILETADALVRSGLRDCGYTILQLDDGWMADERDANGHQYANKDRFPHGLKYLADYLHERKLKLGIYSSAGEKTCAGYPGSFGHEEEDAKTWAAWGIDYLKYDACGNKDGKSDQELFHKMAAALRSTGRPIIFNICIFYSDSTHRWAQDIGNSWRTGGDIVKHIERNPEVSYLNWYETLQTQVLGKEAAAGPGHWNDPDNLIIGYARNNQQTLAEQQAQMSFWSLLSAPLVLGNDVRQLDPNIKAIISNPAVIAVDQDPLGKQGTRILNSDSLELWTKEVMNGDVFLLFNKKNQAIDIDLPVSELKMPMNFRATNLWSNEKMRIHKRLKRNLDPHAVLMIRVDHRKGKS